MFFIFFTDSVSEHYGQRLFVHEKEEVTGEWKKILNEEFREI
jgi:hypothetical protein